MYREAPPGGPVPRLFDANSMALATFLGSPLAGGVLWYLNERRTGRPRQAWIALGCGLALTVAIMVIGSFLHAGALGGGTVGLYFGFRKMSLRWFEKANAEGRIGEVTYASRWQAAGIGLGVMALVLAAAVGVAAAVEVHNAMPNVELGPHQRVFYGPGVTEAEARRLGDTLRTVGFLLPDHPVDVRYERIPTGHAVSLVVTPERAAGPGAEESIQGLAHELQPVTDPQATLELRLCDNEWHPHRRITVP